MTMQWILLILVVPYLIILGGIFRSLRKIKQYPSYPASGIKVSVVIACRNEAGNIENILGDIAVQDYPAGELEVIVIDDNSSDNTWNIVSGFTGISDLKLIRNSGTGKKMAVTTGVNLAGGDLIITTDADCRAGRRWISTIVSFYSRYYPDMIICPVNLSTGSGFFGKFQELEFMSLQGVTTGSAAGGRSTMCNGANLAFKREAFLKHSGNLHYEIPSGDDVFFLHSLKNERGTRIFWLESPAAMVMAAQAPTFLAFLKQRNRWISKGRAYSDRFTMVLAFAVFAVTMTQLFTMAASFFHPEYFAIFITILALKSIPDFLILKNTTRRYGKRRLLRWFLPSLLVYPFYVFGVTLSLVALPADRSSNSPSLKGTLSS